MTYVTVAILTVDEAKALKADAERVLRSLKDRQFCECERPLPLDGPCTKCGKGSRKNVPASVYRAIRTLDELARQQDLHLCPHCRERMALKMAREGATEFWWCQRCEAIEPYRVCESAPTFIPALGFKSTRHKHRKPGHRSAAGGQRSARKPRERWQRDVVVYDWGSIASPK